MKRALIIASVFILFSSGISAQEKISIDGYFSDMQAGIHIPVSGWLWENQFQNRINLNFYPATWLSGSIRLRNRFLCGSDLLVSAIPAEASDPGLISLALGGGNNMGDKSGYRWSVIPDRAWIELSFGKLVIKAGRQRINWGQTFVWNPNDIFNNYSFFDIDYPERPGSDAILLQYYTGEASDMELVAKTDSSGKATASGYFRFNIHGYDIQVLTGILKEKDMVFGLGWSGTLFGLSFRGESTYFRDLEHFADSTGTLMISTGLDYTFSSGLFLQGEVLYSGFAKNASVNDLFGYLNSNLDVKKIGFAPWSFYAGMNYPITPLLTGSLSAIVYPAWKGFYVGPDFEFSVTDNLSLSLISQIFSLATDNPVTGDNERENYFFGFLRLKWNF